MQDNELIEKIKSLPPEHLAEVMDFVNVLAHRDDQLLVGAASRLSEPTFAAVWNNPNDAEYDQGWLPKSRRDQIFIEPDQPLQTIAPLGAAHFAPKGADVVFLVFDL
jgi:hypothetical protein